MYYGPMAPQVLGFRGAPWECLLSPSSTPSGETPVSALGVRSQRLRGPEDCGQLSYVQLVHSRGKAIPCADRTTLGPLLEGPGQRSKKIAPPVPCCPHRAATPRGLSGRHSCKSRGSQPVEKQRRSGSLRTVQGYSSMLQDSFGRVGKAPDKVTVQEVFVWAHGKELGQRPLPGHHRRPHSPSIFLLPLPATDGRRHQQPL